MTLFFLDFIHLLFPIVLYFLYLVYTRALEDKERKIFLDLALISSVYLCYSFKTNTYLSAFLINISLLIALVKKRKISSLILSVFIPYCLNNFFELNFTFYIVQYLGFYLLTNIGDFSPIKSFVLMVLTTYFVAIVFEFLNFNIFLLLAICIFMYIIFNLAIKAYSRVEMIIKLYMESREVFKEKKLYQSLFRITHEIKNPLAVCKGYLDMFDANNVAKSNRYVGIIREEINRTLMLLKDFSDISKLEIVKSFVDIEMLLDDVCDEMKLIFNDKITFSSDVLEQEIFIEADYDRLKQVLINVIKNAKESIENTGAITLKTYLKKKNYVIEIEDNGIGMDKETLSKVGSAFYTTKKNGTGLGVCFSKEIIERHGGKMIYNSKVGEGTKVQIILPTIKEKAS